MRSVAVLTLLVASSLLGFSADHARAATRSATKQLAEAKADAALVYLIREKRFQGSARTMFVFADETFLGTLDNDTYSFAYVPPGKHLLWLNWARVNVEVDLEAGKTYYYSIWSTFDPLDEASGKAFVEAVAAHVTPQPNEIEKSVDHIQDRYGRATASAAAKADDDTRATGLARRAAHVAKWPKVDLTPYAVLCVEPFVMADPRAESRNKEYLVDTAPARLATFILEDLGNTVFTEVRQESACASPGTVALRGRITQYKPGSEAARFIVAGAGNAQIELIVTLADAASGRELVELEAKGAWAWGGAMGVAGGISNLDKNVAYEVASYLKQMRGVPLSDEP
jgi:hypothetical protein